jgi:lipopolysaccharide export LptBFGC system permease protein LptF
MNLMNTEGNPYSTSADDESRVPGVPSYRYLIGFVAQGLALVFLVNVFVLLGMALWAVPRNPGMGAGALGALLLSFFLWRIGRDFRRGKFGVGGSGE